MEHPVHCADQPSTMPNTVELGRSRLVAVTWNVQSMAWSNVLDAKQTEICLVGVTHEASFTMSGATEVTLRHHQIAPATTHDIHASSSHMKRPVQCGAEAASLQHHQIIAPCHEILASSMNPKIRESLRPMESCSETVPSMIRE